MRGTTKPFSSLGKDVDTLLIRFQSNSIDQVRRACIAVSTEVVNATPVDTGRAKGNWLPTLGSPSNTMNWSDSAGFGGAPAVSRIRAVAASYKKGSIFVANNLPYINRLNHGWSKQQSTPGWIERTSGEAFKSISTRWWKR